MLCSNKYENGYIFYYYVFHVSCYCQKPSKCAIGAFGTERLKCFCNRIDSGTEVFLLWKFICKRSASVREVLL